jgi:hypothetical protein
LCNAHFSSRMPDPQTRLQAHKNDFGRLKANNHDKGRIATNKGEPRIRVASVVDSLPCSSLFVAFVAGDGCAFRVADHNYEDRKSFGLG